MDIPYLIQILQKKVIILNNAKAQAFSVGDLEGMNAIDKELLGVNNTLLQLNLLTDVTQAATVNNVTPAAVVASGVQAIQNQTQGPSANAVINGYNISAYATDVLYEQKILNILSSMPTFVNTGDIDTYIQSVAPGSPLTGNMVYAAAQNYNIDLYLLLAIMRNDSNFGTLGVGAKTFNPGNVGNTGTSTQTFGSWAEGVAAVAEWLNRHRIVPPEVLITPTITDVATSTTATSTESLPISLPPPINFVAASSTQDTATTSNQNTATTTANSTPQSNATSTDSTSIYVTASSTLPVATTTIPVATSTSPTASSTTDVASTTSATSTQSVSASSTPATPVPPAASSTTTNASSTQDAEASTTQAYNKIRIRRNRA
ncbi:MAG: hypothetical protein WCG07_00130 [Candidatus Taylorbacteria bacterium]